MAEIKLNVELREGIGKNKTDKLRAEKIVPGVVYGKGVEPKTISISEKELHKVFLSAGTNTIIDLVLGSENLPVLFKEVQKHPYKNRYTHVDFYMIDMKESLRIQIPIILEGRDEIILQPSVLTQQLNEVDIECLPVDIPQAAVYNVTEMQYGDQVLVKDLDIFSNEKLTFWTEAEELVATLQEPREEVEKEETDETIDAADVPTVDETEDQGAEDTEE